MSKHDADEALRTPMNYHFSIKTSIPTKANQNHPKHCAHARMIRLLGPWYDLSRVLVLENQPKSGQMKSNECHRSGRQMKRVEDHWETNQSDGRGGTNKSSKGSSRHMKTSTENWPDPTDTGKRVAVIQAVEKRRQLKAKKTSKEIWPDTPTDIRRQMNAMQVADQWRQLEAHKGIHPNMSNTPTDTGRQMNALQNKKWKQLDRRFCKPCKRGPCCFQMIQYH